MPDLTPYSTADPFLGVKQTWLAPDDATRLAAYSLYESMYRNDPSAYALVRRGSESNPIYIPSAKTIIEACNRYLAKGWTFAVDPLRGTPEQQQAVSTLLDTLFRREQMWTKFGTQKRYGLIRGDAVWHVLADPTKEEGSRISIIELDPGMYFPIEGDTGVIGCHLVDVFQVSPDSTEVAIRRQTYRKDNGRITYEVTWWEAGAWDDRLGSGQELKRAKKIPDGFANIPLTTLPEQITSLPVYHIKNSRAPMEPFGISELQGLERISAGVSQAITDQDLALALAGLGIYVTTSGPPLDDNDEETDWVIGPGYVAEIDGESDFKRVNGITSVTPGLEHIKYLETAMREASGTPDIAIGIVDASIAESGIALQLKMGPLLAKNEEKEQEMLSVYDHMLYDLTHMWFPAYESLDAPDVLAYSVVDDPLPVNRKAVIDELLMLLEAKVVSVEYVQSELKRQFGMDFPTDMLTQMANDAARNAAADPFAARVNAELDGA